MEFYSELNNEKIKIDFDSPIDISVPIEFKDNCLLAWGQSKPKKSPVRKGDWEGSIKNGASVNFNNIFFNPHAHITHTECCGHISIEEESINSVQKSFFFFSKLITVSPKKKGMDLVISEDMILEKINHEFKYETLIIRTNPNLPTKKNTNYSGSNPPYLTKDCILFIKKLGVKNLLIDLPSIDKEKDDGKVINHKIFFDIINGGNTNTITELIYVPSKVPDGDYLLNLQFMPINNDAAPSRPILFKIQRL